ncbi:hypothetical protein GCM10020218_104010 [Dactylosporangium vinaceum]
MAFATIHDHLRPAHGHRVEGRRSSRGPWKHPSDPNNAETAPEAEAKATRAETITADDTDSRDHA